MKSFIGAVIFICVALSANAQLLWKVSGSGLSSPSYIMGTHHLAPLSVKDGITGLQKAMDETQQVYGELKMSDIQSPATIQKMQKMMMIESDTTLTTLLSPEDYETANKFCKENLMMDLNMAPKIKPAFLLNNIAVVAYIKHIGNYNPQEQLDTYFQTQATQKGKKWMDWKLRISSLTCYTMEFPCNAKPNCSCVPSITSTKRWKASKD